MAFYGYLIGAILMQVFARCTGFTGFLIDYEFRTGLRWALEVWAQISDWITGYKVSFAYPFQLLLWLYRLFLDPWQRGGVRLETFDFGCFPSFLNEIFIEYLNVDLFVLQRRIRVHAPNPVIFCLLAVNNSRVNQKSISKTHCKNL